MKQNILIIGAGRAGKAFEYLLSSNKRITISLWDKDATLIPNQGNLKDLASHADVIFLCISSWALKECFDEVGKNISRNTIVVSLTKGIEPTQKQFVSEFLKNNVQEVAILAGPTLAEELVQDMHAKATLAASKENFKIISELFEDSVLSFEHSDDLQGAAAAGVLKNVYAMGLGIADALNYGANFKGFIVTESLKEMRALIPLLGGSEEAAFSLAGLGDLVTTGHSRHSRNRTLAEELISTGSYSVQGEGIASFPILIERLGDKHESFPILTALKKILIDKQKAKNVFSNI